VSDPSSSFFTTSNLDPLTGGGRFSNPGYEAAPADAVLIEDDPGAVEDAADGTPAAARRQSKPIVSRFLGSESALVLPLVLAFGLAALIAGPVLVVVLRRRPGARSTAP
jgi:hypothetical protein